MLCQLKILSTGACGLTLLISAITSSVSAGLTGVPDTQADTQITKRATCSNRPPPCRVIACWTQAQKGLGLDRSRDGNSLRQTVHTHRVSAHRAAKVVASLYLFFCAMPAMRPNSHWRQKTRLAYTNAWLKSWMVWCRCSSSRCRHVVTSVSRVQACRFARIIRSTLTHRLALSSSS